MKKVNIVIIGGGTGTFTVIQGLKHHPQFSLTAIVTMTDSGGSAGRLRDEFGTLPVGDVRQCLVALSKEDEAGNILRELFNYRFPNTNSSLHGHNFGNIFLTALSNILGGEEQAIDAASKILNIKGRIIPVTTDNVDLVAKYDNGFILYGEKNIDEPYNNPKHDCNSRISRLWTQPDAKLNPHAENAIINADYIIMGPGDFYSSLMANIVINGMDKVISASKAKFIYIPNLVSKYGQTSNMKQSDYIYELVKYIGREPDYVLLNNAELEGDILAKYALENSFPIEDDLNSNNIIRLPLISLIEIMRTNDDSVKRSLLRHDSQKLGSAIIDITTK